MKVYIQTDIEGVAGFCFFENSTNPSAENVQHRYRMYRLLTAEVNAAVTGAFDAGATEVLVNDSHGSGYNIQFEDLDPRCELVHGRNCSGSHWLPDFDGTYAALVLVGMHAMGGTPLALVSHSCWSVDGGRILLSEGSMAAALAGHRKVPTVFVSGDDHIAAELKTKVPAIEAVAVKKALSPYQARSLIPRRACERIREGVCNALRRRDRIEPYRIPGPLTLNLLDAAGHIPPLKPVLAQDLAAPDIETAFQQALRLFPWNTMDRQFVDGFQFPPV
jgi:D-amino peptidase